MQSVICGLQSVVCSLQSAVCSLQSAVCSLQSAGCSLQSANVRHRRKRSDRANGEISKFAYYSIIWCMFYTKCHTMGRGRLTVCPR